MEPSGSSCDVLVIGGGVNGVGIARDAAMRGLRVVLVEQNDLGAGATGASSGMIHGGARYLLSDLRTTRKSCRDSGAIQRIAPHLIFRIPFLLPVLREAKWPRLSLELMDTFLSAYDRYAPLKNARRHTRLQRSELLRLEPGLSDDLIGGLSFDEWGIDPHRLCVANALSAREQGADIRTHTGVEAFLRDDSSSVTGAALRRNTDGARETLRARVVINATGPWLPRVAALAGARVRLRPAKGIHVLLDRRIGEAGIITPAIDGRQLFIVPQGTYSMVGTTDDDYYGDPGTIPVSEDEVEYLLEGIERAYPPIRQFRVVRTIAGIRPTLFEWDTYEDNLSRDHEIIDHARTEGIGGLLSVAGGKLAAYRLMAEETVDLICERLAHQGECRTHQEPLAGAEAAVDPGRLAQQYEVPEWLASALCLRHGCRASRVLGLTQRHPERRSLLCPCRCVSEAEVHYVVREEWAMTLGDLCRRTGLTGGACLGQRCLFRALAILAEYRGWNSHQMRRAVAEYLEQLRGDTAPLLRRGALPQRQLLDALLGGFDL